MAKPTSWTASFEHLGRTYQIYKRHQTKSAPYQFCVTRRGRRIRQSLETNVAAVAIERAKAILVKATAEKWGELERIKIRRPGQTRIGELCNVYREVAQLSPVTIRNNVSSLAWLIRVATGQENPDQLPISVLDGSLISRFQRGMVTRYLAKAPQLETAQREARERALRTNRSVIRQARSLFARTGIRASYEERGISLPESIEQFLDAELEGRVTKTEYHPPDDAIIEKTFQEVDRFCLNDPDLYTAFWLAVGAGLRRSEIAHARWEWFVDRDGATWISGGTGKDGQRIEVPVQQKAVAKLTPVRRAEGRCIQESSLEWARRLNGWMRGLGWTTQKAMHELRSYVGGLIYRQDPMAAMRFLRHKSIRLTEQFYVRYGKDALPPQVL